MRKGALLTKGVKHPLEERGLHPSSPCPVAVSIASKKFSKWCRYWPSCCHSIICGRSSAVHLQPSGKWKAFFDTQRSYLAEAEIYEAEKCGFIVEVLHQSYVGHCLMIGPSRSYDSSVITARGLPRFLILGIFAWSGVDPCKSRVMAHQATSRNACLPCVFSFDRQSEWPRFHRIHIIHDLHRYAAGIRASEPTARNLVQALVNLYRGAWSGAREVVQQVRLRGVMS